MGNLIFGRFIGLTNDAGTSHGNKAVIEVKINDYTSAELEESERNKADISEKLRRIFEAVVCREKHPRTKIVLSFEVLSSSKSLMPHLINLASYSLLEAGVSVVDTISCVTCGLINNAFVVDLEVEEVDDCDFSMILANLKFSQEVSYFKTFGALDLNNEKLSEVRITFSCDFMQIVLNFVIFWIFLTL